ncbi:MAG: hypothetical protein KDK30_18555 [Leptospiraceae bacterium]|nr:hypothetical protein [Leptospiraceae bacterium]
MGLPEEEDDFDFAERSASLKTDLEGQTAEKLWLNKTILENLDKVGIGQKVQ